jgi:pilus assembly protein CpaD
LNYPKVTADAGPCGLWPEDLGPSFRNPIYQDNRPYSNFGCASQRNMAAMVANPADLVQPRPESPSLTPRRTTVLGKYSRGEPTATQYPDAEKGKISEVGK